MSRGQGVGGDHKRWGRGGEAWQGGTVGGVGRVGGSPSDLLL